MQTIQSRTTGILTLSAGIVLLAYAAAAGAAKYEVNTVMPSRIATVGSQIAACVSKGIETPFGFLGCNPHGSTRSVGDARFVSAPLRK